MDTKKIFNKILKRIRAGELIIQSVDEIKIDRDEQILDYGPKGEAIRGPLDKIHLEIKLTVIPKGRVVSHEN